MSQKAGDAITRATNMTINEARLILNVKPESSKEEINRVGGRFKLAKSRGHLLLSL